MKIVQSKFIKSIVKIDQRPEPDLPEFAFAGRSNVGKSSLLNCLVNRKNFAKVSKQPGKTRTINYFLINNELYFVDLPGYGYAKVSGQEKEQWRRMIETYLIDNPKLISLYVLLDAKVGPQANDLQLIEWLQFENIPFYIIITKADKIKRSHRRQREKEIKEKLNIPIDFSLIFFSIRTREGKQQILSHMNDLHTSMKITEDPV